MPPVAKPLSLRAYAKARGISHEAVRRAIESRRLEHSIVMVKGEPKIADVELADREWAERTRSYPDHDEDAAPEDGPDAGISYNEARRRREVELWRQARVRRVTDELDLARRRGELVSVEEARGTVIDRFTAVKTRLLGLPARVKQRLPHVSSEDVGVIDGLVREALEELADGGE